MRHSLLPKPFKISFFYSITLWFEKNLKAKKTAHFVDSLTNEFLIISTKNENNIQRYLHLQQFIGHCIGKF